ncbi:MAG: TrbI F-type domain-containing protein [Rhodospirillales bacterium]|nr:TrbI F-type domain-containing protein [Rhodospirillales bacterium]
MPRRPDRGWSASVRPSVDLPALLATLLLAAAVASAVAVAMVRLTQPDPPRIASVRLGELTARFALDVAGHDSSEEAAAAEARRWATALERALAAVAETHRAVILPARAVAAGALDLTPEVEAALARALQETAAGAPAAPEGARP